MLTPAFFWKQANVANREWIFISRVWFAPVVTSEFFPVILGGAGLGTGAGLYYHWGRSLSGDNPPPTVPRPGASEPL